MDAPTANQTIKDGLCIHNERFTIRKDRKEPIKCAKCQKFSHIARNCTAASDTCGTCGAHHRTADCNAYKTELCTNCNAKGHTSWSRNCPEFLRCLEILNNSFPKNRSPFYPTETPWTQVAHPPRNNSNPHQPRTDTPPQPQSQTRSHSAFSTLLLSHFTQTKLPFNSSPPRRKSLIPLTQPDYNTNLFPPAPLDESDESSEHTSSWFDA